MLTIEFIEITEDDTVKVTKSLTATDAKDVYNQLEGQNGFAFIKEGEKEVGVLFAGAVAWRGEYATVNNLPMSEEEVEAFRGN